MFHDLYDLYFFKKRFVALSKLKIFMEKLLIILLNIADLKTDVPFWLKLEKIMISKPEHAFLYWLSQKRK